MDTYPPNSREGMLLKVAGDKVVAIGRESFRAEHLERHLEEIVEKAPAAFLGFDVLLIGRQVRVERGIIDLLALDKDGNIVIIELKRSESPREIVSQANSYRAQFHHDVTTDDLNKFAEDYYGQTSDETPLLRKKFKERFGSIPSKFNRKQIIVLIAEEFDSSILKEIDVLAPICIEFSFYRSSEGEKYIAVRYVAGPSTAPQLEDPQAAGRLREYEGFFDKIAEETRKLLPDPLRNYKNTRGHWKTAQNLRFHWSGTDIHVGVSVERRKDGDVGWVYFCNYKRDPRVTTILNENEKLIKTKLSLKAGEFNLEDPRDPINQSLGKVKSDNATPLVQFASKCVANYLLVLKPLLGPLL